jgi:DNA polymerase III subunit epsilon
MQPMFNLNLTKPLAFFDLETTGTNVASDRIVEISIVKIHPGGAEESKTMRINPGMPIPLESSKIHGIYDHHVANCPTFRQVGGELARFLEHCDLAGYNSNKFDVPLLAEEFLRNEIDFDLKGRRLVDVQNIFHLMEQRTLSAAYRFYCQKELTNAHSAEADVRATYEILKAQVQRYENADFTDKSGKVSQPVKNDIRALSEFSTINRNADLMGRIIFNDDGVEVFNFGKHAGKPVAEILKTEPSYYNWMMNGDFPLYTKKVLTAIKLRDFNKN